MKNKIFIGIITGNELQNIKELTQNLSNIDGILAVDHYSTDGTYELLKEKCGDGEVIQCPYQNNHSQSMNIWMNSKKLQIGDWVILLDSSERLGSKLQDNLRDYILHFERSGINTVVNHSKVFIFRRWPQMFFSGTPHWGLRGGQQNYLAIESSGLFEKEEDYYYSIRNNKRDSKHWISHYLRYYLQLDSNHLLLGLEGKPNFTETFSNRENQRIRFLYYLKLRNLPPTIDSINLLCNDGVIDPEFKEFVNTNKILNDYYQYAVLNNQNLVDNHNWDEIIKI
jgi:hypothetical protein